MPIHGIIIKNYGLIIGLITMQGIIVMVIIKIHGIIKKIGVIVMTRYIKYGSNNKLALNFQKNRY